MERAATPQGLRQGGRLFSKSPEVRRRVLRAPVRSVAFSGEYATLGLTPFASKTEVKHAYKRLALKVGGGKSFSFADYSSTSSTLFRASIQYHPDVIKGEVGGQEKSEAFKEIKFAYKSLMTKFEEEDEYIGNGLDDDEWDEWDEWMGFEGGMPMIYNPS